MNETVTLHGGIRHGEERVIPEGHDELKMDVIVALDKNTKGVRQGHYTRVHKLSGEPSHEFEWAGFTSPVVPIQAG